jgi:myo-inositol 2-dehydrogenase / D-chiro-inositol 1-dehydrogenase
MKNNETAFNRRQFIGALAATGAVAAACSGGGTSTKNVDYELTTLLDKAPDGQEIKAGVIGCGGRGSGAAKNFLEAGSNVKVVALADVFPDRLNSLKDELRELGNAVADENCFVGLDAFEKLLDLKEINYVILATPPNFRPPMFKAAVEAKKNVFMEKPVAVDPVGARSVMASSKKAKELGLNVVTGTQRRHQHHYVSLYKQIQSGAIGDLVSANVYWNGGQLWYRDRQRGWSDLEWMIRDWVNWAWLSGDHIVEQHVHNLDVAYWFMGKHPVSAVGFGSRQRRVTGDQFDNFSIDFSYDDGRHIHSMCRQINGCANNVSESFSGTKGFARSSSNNAPNQTFLKDKSDSVIWTYLDAVKEGMPEKPISAYVQEHVDLIWAIRTGNQIVEAENTATSTLMAIMGRTSAYTGKEVTWEEMMNSKMTLGPTLDDLSLAKRYTMVKKPVVPIAGVDKS